MESAKEHHGVNGNKTMRYLLLMFVIMLSGCATTKCIDYTHEDIMGSLVAGDLSKEDFVMKETETSYNFYKS